MKSFLYIIVVSLSVLTLSGISAQEKSPKADKQSAVSEAEGESETDERGPAEIGMLLEYFEVDHRIANRLVSRFSPRASDAKELRTILGEMTEKGEAILVETSWMRARSGPRIKTLSVAENITPTEYDPPEIPNSVGDVSGKEGASSPPVYLAAARPTAFETWHVGHTVEVDPVLSNDAKSVHVNMTATTISRLADRHYTRRGKEASASGIDNISMATYHRMSNVNQTLAISGNYSLHGLHAPPEKPSKRIICLLKVDVFRPN